MVLHDLPARTFSDCEKKLEQLNQLAHSVGPYPGLRGRGGVIPLCHYASLEAAALEYLSQLGCAQRTTLGDYRLTLSSSGPLVCRQFQEVIPWGFSHGLWQQVHLHHQGDHVPCPGGSCPSTIGWFDPSLSMIPW